MTARRLPPYQGLKGGPTQAQAGWRSPLCDGVRGAWGAVAVNGLHPAQCGGCLDSLRYAAGLLIARGRGHWPAILMGSFVLNAAVNLVMPDRLASALIAALAIAVGNSAEAVMVAAVADRFADGKRFLGTARSIRNFLLLAVPLPPLVSASIGVAASHLAELPAKDSDLQVFWTWYVANAAGIMIFSGLVVCALEGGLRRFSRKRAGELLLLGACLAFASQALSGVYFSAAVAEWTKPYMVIHSCYGPPCASVRPVVWRRLPSSRSAPRSAPCGAFRSFRPPRPGRPDLPADLSRDAGGDDPRHDGRRHRGGQCACGVGAAGAGPTREVEQLLRRSEVFATLVAHDLKSPVYGIRNTVRTCISGITRQNLSMDDVLPRCR